MRATSPEGLVGKNVQFSLWGYVPDCTGEDVDKDTSGEVRGVIEGVNLKTGICKVKPTEFRPNVGGAEWSGDVSDSNMRGHLLSLSHWYDDHFEEYFYNLDVI